MESCFCCNGLFTAHPKAKPLADRNQAAKLNYRRQTVQMVNERTNCSSYSVANKLHRSTLMSCTIEEIELKCYSISPQCLLVEADKRCSLIVQRDHLSGPMGCLNGEAAQRTTCARPLLDLDEGRKYLDGVRQPDEVGLLRLRLDKDTGQLERQLQMRSINKDNEHFLELEPNVGDEDDKRRLRELRMAERLSTRSFVLIERTDLDQSELMIDSVDGVLENNYNENNHRGADDNNQDEGNQLRQDNKLLSSLSIELVESCDIKLISETQQVAVTKPTKQRTKRFNWRRLFGGGKQQIYHHQLDNGHRTRLSESSSGRGCLTGSDQEEDLQMNSQTANNNNNNHLERPDSIYLWPEPLTEVYSSVLNGATTISGGGGCPFKLTRQLSARPPPLVMISYNHREAKEFAIRLHEQLELLGVRTYLDLYEIKKGQDWQDSLNFAILDCCLFVPLVTPSYGETLWTSREFKLADVLNKQIVPINFAQLWPPPSLAIQFATLQYFDWLYMLDSNSMGKSAESNGQQLELVGPKWPRECVQAIAKQLRQILVQAEAFVWSGSCQTSAKLASGTLANGHGGADSSGYESHTPTPLVRSQSPQPTSSNRAPLVREARETDSMLAFERAAQNHRARNKNHLKLAKDQEQNSDQKWPHSNSNSPSASTTRSYGSMGESPLPATTSANISHQQTNANCTSGGPLKRRKKSLGERTKKVFRRFRRSLASSNSERCAAVGLG